MIKIVSILVLVDLAREFWYIQNKWPDYLFQSLFQWILLANAGHVPALQVPEQLFQSLFQWILLANWRSGFFSMYRNIGFNPCFSGSCSRICLNCITPPLSMPFQSLFQWILLANLDTETLYGYAKLSFNPCFSGSCSRILWLTRYHTTKIMFQSLFQWILLANRANFPVFWPEKA